MGHLPNKAKRMTEEALRAEREERQSNGWTVFHFDFQPNLTRRNMTLGEAIRHLMRVTGFRISFWRCPMRGLAIQYHELPKTNYVHDSGERYVMLHFSDAVDVTEAKRALVIDMLLSGIKLYRGWPNEIFQGEVERIRWLLKAPPSIDAQEWLAVKNRLDVRNQRVVRTHEPDLRANLLGEKGGPKGYVLTVAPRLQALDRK